MSVQTETSKSPTALRVVTSDAPARETVHEALEGAVKKAIAADALYAVVIYETPKGTLEIRGAPHGKALCFGLISTAYDVLNNAIESEE